MKNKPKDLRIRQRDPRKFVKLNEIVIDEKKGIYAVVGTMKNDLTAFRIQSLIFNTDPEKGNVWTLYDAKQWVKEHKNSIKESSVSVTLGIE